MRATRLEASRLFTKSGKKPAAVFLASGQNADAKDRAHTTDRGEGGFSLTCKRDLVQIPGIGHERGAVGLCSRRSREMIVAHPPHRIVGETRVDGYLLCEELTHPGQIGI